MDGLNVGRILAGLGNPEFYLRRIKQEGTVQQEPMFNSSFSQARPNIPQRTNPLNELYLNNQLPMNQLASMDRSIYVKNLLGLPQTLSAILLAAQSKTPLVPMNLPLNNINEEVVKNQAVLKQVFSDTDGISPEKMIQNQLIQQNIQQAAAPKDAVAQMFSGMIHIPAISDMIVKNSKQAIAGLIIAMASASKHGMTNEQINETLSIINSCVSMAESGSPTQTIKSLMLLYLPWLPLNEGVGFDLEVETDNGENDSNDSRLTVLIKTKHFGNVKGLFTLTTSNSVDILITCSENFPKTLLQRSLMDEGSSHSMTLTVDVEAVEPKNNESADKQEAKVILSATNEMNPYLLLIAHAFIRNTIYIDSNAILEDIPANDK